MQQKRLTQTVTQMRIGAESTGRFCPVLSAFMWFGFSLNIAMQFLTFRAVDTRYDFKRFASESLDKKYNIDKLFSRRYNPSDLYFKV